MAQVLHIGWGCQIAGHPGAHQIRDAPDIKRDHRGAARHAFQQHVAKALAEARQDKDIGRAVEQRFQACPADVAQRPHVQVRGTGERVAAFAHEEDHEVFLYRRRQALEGLEQDRAAFVGAVEMRRREEEHLFVRRDAQGRPTQGLVERVVGVGVQAIGDVVDWQMAEDALVHLGHHPRTERHHGHPRVPVGPAFEPPLQAGPVAAPGERRRRVRVRAVATAAAPALAAVIHGAMAGQGPHIAHRKDGRFVRRQGWQRQVAQKLSGSVVIHHIGRLEGGQLCDAERAHTVHVIEPQAPRHVTKHPLRQRGAWNGHGRGLRDTATQHARINASFPQTVVQAIRRDCGAALRDVFPEHLQDFHGVILPN